MSSIAVNIRKLREQAGLTQDVLAERLHVTRQTVSNWETGKNEPDIESMEALSEMFQVELTELIQGEGKTPAAEERKETAQSGMTTVEEHDGQSGEALSASERPSGWAVIRAVLFGVLTILTIADWLLLDAYLLEMKGRNYMPGPYVFNRFVILPLGCLCAGLFVCSLFFIRRRPSISRRAKWIFGIFGIVLMIPVVLSSELPIGFLIQYLSFGQPTESHVIITQFSRICSALWDFWDGGSGRFFLGMYILPFISGLLLFIALLKTPKS